MDDVYISIFILFLSLPASITLACPYGSDSAMYSKYISIQYRSGELSDLSKLVLSVLSLGKDIQETSLCSCAYIARKSKWGLDSQF